MPAKGSIITLLFRILGRRVFLSFGLVTFLIVFLLSAVTVTSRYAMQRYVADQVERLPWDLSVYQTAEVPLAERLSGSIAAVSGIAGGYVDLDIDDHGRRTSRGEHVRDLLVEPFCKLWRGEVLTQLLGSSQCLRQVRNRGQ